MHYDYWLANIPGIGSKTIQKLLLAAGSAEEIFRMGETQTEKLAGIGPKLKERLNAAKKYDSERAYEELMHKGVCFTSFERKNYPGKLRNMADPPYALYWKGELADKSAPSVAIVGARQCSEYGYAVAKEIGRKLAFHGASVISGMARGIDAGGQWGAIKGGGKTYAVLGCGPDVCYPSEARNLYAEILNKKGGILSEYPPGTQPKAGHFPCRNRIIAGLCDCAVVVEAKKQSGSLITVDFALEQGKDVYAVPGRICDSLSAGCNSLIEQGAGIVLSVEELIEKLGFLPSEQSNSRNFKNLLLEKQERMVYCCLGCQPKNIEALLKETALSMPELLAALAKLIQKEYIIEYFKNYYIRRF